MGEKVLNEIRTKIDSVDKSLQKLLEERAELMLEVAKAKESSSETPVFYRPEREYQVIDKVLARNKGPLDNDTLRSIFMHIISAGRSLQSPLNVAFLGPDGSFTHQAMLQQFGGSTEKMPQASIARVFRAVDSRHADYGIVPLENSVSGLINETLDCLLKTSSQICGELILPVQQNFLINPKDKVRLRRVYSHQQSLVQCQRWLEKNHPTLQQIPVSSNARAAELAREEQGAAAIAGDFCAEIYGLEVQEANIQDVANNATRFVVIGREGCGPSGRDKTSLFMATPDTPGALVDALSVFEKNQINLTMIQSRPYEGRNWSYLFYVDMEGHQDDEHVQKAFSEFEQRPMLLQRLGSYPRGAL